MPPPRLRLPRHLNSHLKPSIGRPLQQCRCASAAVAAAYTPAPPIENFVNPVRPIERFPPTQPPTYRRPEFRKTQLLRQYTALLQSSPLILIFQHNNLTSAEWTGIRRELARALHKVDADLAKGSEVQQQALADGIKLNVIQTGLLRVALRLVEFYDPTSATRPATVHATDPATDTSREVSGPGSSSRHLLSAAARNSAKLEVRQQKRTHGLEPLISGPLAVVAFPALSPQHLAAVLRILSPDKQFVAPKRKAEPTYHEPAVQTGLQKLMLLGARVEGRAFDGLGVRWVGGIEGGIDGLRAQLVGLLTAAGASLTGALQAAAGSVYFTVEGRRQQLEDEGKTPES